MIAARKSLIGTKRVNHYRPGVSGHNDAAVVITVHCP
jgi:hypothetical protein